MAASREPQSSTASELRRQISLNTQASVGGSEMDPLRVLPPEISLKIFDYVPVADIVHKCRLVSGEWRRFLDDASFWQLRMIRGNNFDPRLRDFAGLPDLNWPQLYIHACLRPNIIRNFVGGELSLEWWSLDYSSWENFSQQLKPVAPPARRDRARRWGGGNGWHCETSWINPDADKKVVEENEGSVKNYVTSYEWCCREQVVDLAQCGFVPRILDALQPAIEVSEWFCARNDCGSLFEIRVDLLNKNRKSVQTFRLSEVTEQWQGGRLGWRKVEHTFRNYGPGIRYLRFADAGKDTLWWAGLYGSKMAGAWARVVFQA